MSVVQTGRGMSQRYSSTRRRARRASGTLRERHVEQTREMIFDALLEEVASRGITEFNIPQLARDAGVSVRTIYRYFPTKDALLEAFGDWLDDQIGLQEWPEDAEALARGAEVLFLAFDEREPIVRSQWVTPQGRAIRARNRVRRLASRRQVLREVTANLDEREAEDAVAIVSYLLSSRAWMALKDDFNMDGERSGTAVSWAIGALVADLRRRNKLAAKPSSQRRPTRRRSTNPSDQSQ